MANKYRRPPITEAVIELRVEGALSREDVDKVQKRLSAEYPFSQQGQVVDVEVGQSSAKIQQQFQNYRLSSTDGADVVLLTSSSIATARLAPYEGWENFISRAKTNWDLWKRTVGFRKLTRLGVRYINRLDIPEPESQRIRLSNYVNVFPQLPNIGIPGIANFAMNVVSPLGKDDCKLILNVGVVPSPLVKTASFVLDLDVSREPPPSNEQELWALVDRIRNYKNAIFEGAITDATRQLFL